MTSSHLARPNGQLLDGKQLIGLDVMEPGRTGEVARSHSDPPIAEGFETVSDGPSKQRARNSFMFKIRGSKLKFESRWFCTLLSLLLFFCQVSRSAQTTGDRLNEASRHYDAREYEKALVLIRPLLEENPENKPAVQLAALSYYFMGKLAEAIPYLEKSLQWFPDNVNYQNILGLCYIQTSSVEKSRSLFSKMFGVPPDSAQGFLINAQMFLRQGIWNRAEEEGKHSLAADPSIPQGHLLLAEAAMGMNRVEEAAAEFRAEIGINPGLWVAHYRLGEVLERLQKADEAAPSLQKAIWLNPNFTGPYILLGKILKAKGMHSLAAQMLEQAVKLDPRNSNAHYMLGQTYQSLGRNDEANRELKMAEDLLKSR